MFNRLSYLNVQYYSRKRGNKKQFCGSDLERNAGPDPKMALILNVNSEHVTQVYSVYENKFKYKFANVVDLNKCLTQLKLPI